MNVIKASENQALTEMIDLPHDEHGDLLGFPFGMRGKRRGDSERQEMANHNRLGSRKHLHDIW